MHDRVLAAILVVPVTIIVLLVLTMVVVEYVYEESPNPVDEIPKVIFDRVENETVVTVIAVGEIRYDAIHINYTTGNGTRNVSAYFRYSLATNISQGAFVLNVTAISGDDRYMLNCTVEVDITSPQAHYFWIQEEEDLVPSRHRSPFTILAEWREMR